MNLNDHKKNLLYSLGTLVVGMLFAAAILAASTARAATVSTDHYNLENQESPYDSSSYHYSFNKEFIPVDRSSLIDNLLRTRVGCPKYLSLIEQFTSCSLGQFDTGYVSESNDQNRSTNVEHPS